MRSAGPLASPPRSGPKSKRASRSGSPPPANALTTYPLLRLEPAATTADALDLGSDPSLAAALKIALATGRPQLSAPVRVQGDGRLGVFAFVPVFGRGLPLRTPAERREALTGVVTGALAADALVRNALLRALRLAWTSASPTGRLFSRTAPAAPQSLSAQVGGRTWRVSLAPSPASALAPVGVAFAGLALMILLGAASMRLRRRAASEAALETTLALERSTSAFALARAETKVDEEQEARRLVADATDSLVLEVDKDGIVRSCSPAVERLLGYTAAELVGLEAYSLLHPDDLLTPANGPQRYARKDGSYVVLEGRRLTRRDELGFVAGVVTVLHDTTNLALKNGGAAHPGCGRARAGPS